MNEFYAQLAVILEEDAIGPDDVLRDFEEWDSLSVLSIVALANSKHGVVLGGDDIASVRTAGELAELIARKKG